MSAPRLMLDSMIYDHIVELPEVLEALRSLVASGGLDIVTTHVQEDELARIPDVGRREAVALVPRRLVPTTEFVLDLSRLGQARLGSGHVGGLVYEEIVAGNRDHSEDALIALTAASEADVLVTEDKRLANRVREAGSTVEVWGFADLRAWLNSGGGPDGSR